MFGRPQPLKPAANGAAHTVALRKVCGARENFWVGGTNEKFFIRVIRRNPWFHSLAVPSHGCYCGRATIASGNMLVKILITGSTTLGLAVAAGFLVGFPGLRTPADILWACVVVAVLGSAIFAPLAAAFAYRTHLRRWLTVHGSAVQWYASILMAISLGYLLASARYHPSDVFAGLAMLVIFLCVLAKAAIAIAFRAGNEPPLSGDGESGAPLAPVPRPPGGRPPALSAAAEVEHESAA